MFNPDQLSMGFFMWMMILANSSAVDLVMVSVLCLVCIVHHDYGMLCGVNIETGKL